MEQLKVNAFEHRPHEFHEELKYVSEWRAQRAHVIRNGIQHTQHQGSVVALQLDIETTTISIVIVLVLVLGIRIRRIASICALCAAVCPGHRLLKFIQMRQILIHVKQGMINIGAALVTPHGQIAKAQHQRMHLPSTMLLHMLIDITSTSDDLTDQT